MTFLENAPATNTSSKVFAALATMQLDWACHDGWQVVTARILNLNKVVFG